MLFELFAGLLGKASSSASFSSSSSDDDYSSADVHPCAGTGTDARPRHAGARRADAARPTPHIRTSHDPGPRALQNATARISDSAREWEARAHARPVAAVKQDSTFCDGGDGGDGGGLAPLSVLTAWPTMRSPEELHACHARRREERRAGRKRLTRAIMAQASHPGQQLHPDYNHF